MGSRAEVNLAKRCPEVTLTNIAAVLDSHPTATYNNHAFLTVIVPVHSASATPER